MAICVPCCGYSMSVCCYVIVGEGGEDTVGWCLACGWMDCLYLWSSLCKVRLVTTYLWTVFELTCPCVLMCGLYRNKIGVFLCPKAFAWLCPNIHTTKNFADIATPTYSYTPVQENSYTSVHKHSHTHLLPCLWNLDIVSTTMFYINKQTGFVLSVDSLLARETRFVVQQFAAGALSTKPCSEVMGWVQTRLSFTILCAKNVIKGEEMGHARKMGQGSP